MLLFQLLSTVKKNNTMPLGGKQNVMRFGGEGGTVFGGPVLVFLYREPKKQGKEFMVAQYSARGHSVWGIGIVLGVLL